MSTARPSVHALRFTAAALALLFATGQLASFAHLALIQHRRCAEHGELIDVQGHDATSTAIAPASADGAQIAGAPAEADHRHEHCTAASQRREKTTATPERDMARYAGADASHSLPSQHALARVSQAVYRLAPKTSPPV